ncbi:porin family protein [Aquabacterium soli]|uniref:Porin family protein n=2 Tax=Aquabacterium soli TaxID=2493092 RepID=A0A426V6L3_9BURK|nr:porin family protein [Aquabacterium soli]
MLSSTGVKSLIALMLGAVAVGAQAQSYAGALVQMSDYNNDRVCSSYGVSNCDNKATGYKVYAGSMLSSSAGVEAALINFGKVKGDSREEGLVKSIVLAAVLKVDVFRGLAISGKVGVAATTAQVKAGGADDDEQHPSLYLGAGIEYPIYKTIKIVGAYDFTRAQLNSQKFSVSSFGLGAQVDF